MVLSVVCVGSKSGIRLAGQRGALAPLGYSKALWHKTVKTDHRRGIASALTAF